MNGPHGQQPPPNDGIVHHQDLVAPSRIEWTRSSASSTQSSRTQKRSHNQDALVQENSKLKASCTKLRQELNEQKLKIERLELLLSGMTFGWSDIEHRLKQVSSPPRRLLTRKEMISRNSSSQQPKQTEASQLDPDPRQRLGTSKLEEEDPTPMPTFRTVPPHSIPFLSDKEIVFVPPNYPRKRERRRSKSSNF